MFIPGGSYFPWFALYVKPKHEKNVALMLGNKGYETFLPTYPHRVKNYKKFDLPLFPGYIFCRLELSNRLPVMKTPGVFSIVGNGAEPQSIPEEQIQAVQRVVQSEWEPIPWPYVLPGHEVSFESGPLQGVHGVVMETSDGKWLVVSVHLLRRSVAVKVSRASLSIRIVSRNGGKLKDAHFPAKNCASKSSGYSR